MKYLVAIDPGAEHCGLAIFSYAPECKASRTLTPHGLYGTLINLMRAGAVQEIVYERYQQYGNGRTGDEFPTVEVIGVIKFLADAYEVPYTPRGAAIKTAVRKLIEARKLPTPSKEVESDLRIHAADAELHGYSYILQKKGSK